MKHGAITRARPPTVLQELLLRAALAEGDEALVSWRQWQQQADLNRLDGGTVRLLPLLYHNLKLSGVEDSGMERLQQEYLKTWRYNEILFHEMASQLRLFRSAGVETMLLKGAALALSFYQDAGLRPMSDIDLLVRPEKARLAISLLHQAGWKSAYESPEVLIPYRHAVEFSNDLGLRLDLHWRALWDGSQESGDRDFWDGAVPLEINNVPARILNPTDQLLHVCVHGAAWSNLPPLIWVADAAIILKRTQQEIDWDRLIAQVRKRRLMLPMAAALGYLQRFLGADAIPAEVLTTVRQMRASTSERVLYRLRTNPNRELRKFATLYCWFRAWRLANDSRSNQAPNFFRHLQSFWGVQHLWQTPFYLVLESARSVKRIFWPSSVKEGKSR